MPSAARVFDVNHWPMNQPAKIDIRHSTCPHDCPSACALDVEVIDGSSIGRVHGSKLQTYTAGVICAKVARYAERIHHPDRLTASAAPHRPEGLRTIRADFLGRGAGRNRRSLQRGRARVRCAIGLALLLCRHDGARDARRHQPPCPCEEIFALLLDHLRQSSPASDLPSAPARSPASIRARWASPTWS